MRNTGPRRALPALLGVGSLLLLGPLAPAEGQAPLALDGQLPLQAAAEQIVGSQAEDWSILAWSVDRNQPLLAFNPNDVRVPASNNKVFSAIWALDMLGPDYRFPTDLLVAGPVQQGVLRGNVYIRGSGDPAFGYPEFTEDPMEPLRIMARQLKARGVTAVEGGVVGDATAFDTLLVSAAWPRDTGGGSAQYAPGTSGLPFQRNMLWVRLTPAPGGGPALVTKEPAVDEIPVVSTARTGGGRAWAVRREGSDTIQVKGAVAGRGAHRYGVGVHDPALLTAGALRRALLDEGITVRGRAVTGETPKAAKLVHRHFSIPLRDMLPKLNRDSDNFFAEHLFKAASHAAIGQGSYTRGGPASALHFIENAEVPPGQLYQMDGSGLSSYNQASAYAMVRALVYAHERPWTEVFHKSLAIAGDRSGSMARLFRGTPAEGNLHAKTGYIRRVRTLSGYVRAENGELIAFSFLYNGPNTSGARAVQENLGNLLATYGAAPPAP